MRPVSLELEHEQFVSNYHVSNSSPHHTTRVCVCVCVHCMHVGMFSPLPSNRSFYRQIDSYGVGVGDREVS